MSQLSLELTGQRFGRLTVLGLARDIKQPGLDRWWHCRCDCGVERPIRTRHLTSGAVRSCGCLRRENRLTFGQRALRKHGRSETPEWWVWHAIMARCVWPGTRHSFRFGSRYYDRGIRICKRWRESFSAFWKDMGPRPSASYSIDRINNNGGYTCGQCSECLAMGWAANCRWATRKQQGRNRRDNHLLTHAGVTLPLSAWAEQFSMHYETLRHRLLRGWSPERALLSPVQIHRCIGPLS